VRSLLASGSPRVPLSFKQPFIKMKDRRRLDLYLSKLRVVRIEQEVMFPSDHRRRDLQDGTRSGTEPPVAQLYCS
jgi:hypothetical protein